VTVDPAVLIAAISALASGLGVVARILYNDLKKDRDYWRALALMGTELADKAATLADRKRFDG